jgi:transcriptional regulator
LGHVARANPHGHMTSAFDALATFIGPNCYVTPSYYAAKREHGKVVPTWNYIAIHASGPLRFFEDKAPLLDIVTRLTNTHEGKREKSWAVTDAPADYVDTMLKAIVGFELPIAKLEGKWKLSQNKSEADVAGIREGLAAEQDEDASALASEMRGR